jgi:hypothetical protein
MTKRVTVLVPHLSEGKVVEYDKAKLFHIEFSELHVSKKTL